MTDNTTSRFVYKLTVFSDPNTLTRISLDPGPSGKLAIDYSVGPIVNPSRPLSPPQVPVPPPGPLPSPIPLVPHAPSPPKASTSTSTSHQLPSTSQAINHFFEVMPTQIRNDFNTWFETESQIDEGETSTIQKQLAYSEEPNNKKRKADEDKSKESALKRGKVEKK